jgi:hypothetical protein
MRASTLLLQILLPPVTSGPTGLARIDTCLYYAILCHARGPHDRLSLVLTRTNMFDWGQLWMGPAHYGPRDHLAAYPFFSCPQARFQWRSEE